MRRYAITGVVVCGAIAAQWALWPIFRGGPYLLLYPAVVICALFGSAPLAVVLSAVSAQYLFFEPRYSWVVEPRVFLMQAAFGVAGLAIWRLASSRESALRRAQKARARSETLASELRTTLVSIGDAVVTTDFAGRIVFLNPAGEALTGWSLAQASGAPLNDVFRICNEYTRAKVPCPVDVVLRTGKVVGLTNHTVLIRRDHSEVAIEDRAAPIRDAEGRMVGVVLVFRDATVDRVAQRRLAESEAQFRAMFNLAGVGMFQADAHTGEFQRVNSMFCSMLGYSEEALLNSCAQQLRAPGHETTGMNELKDLLAGRSTGFQAEVSCLTADGRVITLLANTVLTTHKPPTTVTAVVDITQAKANEARLVDAIRARDQFLSIASHELKTPLTSSKLQTQLRMRYLKRNEAGAFTQDKLAKMLENDIQQIDRLVRLVDDMLDIARINTGKLTLQREPFDLRQLVQDVLERSELQLEAAGCSVQVQAEQPVPGVWDRFRVEQVVVNLLTNAMRYGARRPIHIAIGRKGELAELRVKDHGRGISRADQERIFECFERAVSANEVSGLGLGLYISNRIAAIHGGSIAVDSTLGQGATFTVRMPLDVEAEVSSNEQEAVAASSQTELLTTTQW